MANTKLAEKLDGSSARVYGAKIESFIEYCRAGGINIENPADAAVALRGFMRENGARWREDAVKRSAVSAVRNYFVKQFGEGFTDTVSGFVNPSQFTSGHKVENPLRMLNKKVLRKIYSMDRDDFYCHRDFALLDLVINTMAAPREIVSLEATDFDLEDRTLYIPFIAKRDNRIVELDREIPIDAVDERYASRVEEFIEHYLDYAVRKGLEIDDDFPFIVSGEQEGRLAGLKSAERISYLVGRRLGKLGLDIGSRELREHGMAMLAEKGYGKKEIKAYRGLLGYFRTPTVFNGDPKTFHKDINRVRLNQTGLELFAEK